MDVSDMTMPGEDVLMMPESTSARSPPSQPAATAHGGSGARGKQPPAARPPVARPTNNYRGGGNGNNWRGNGGGKPGRASGRDNEQAAHRCARGEHLRITNFFPLFNFIKITIIKIKHKIVFHA
jgi:hypothetical protein